MKKKLTLSIVLLVALAVVMSLTIFVSNVKATTATETQGDVTYEYEVNNDGNTVTIKDITVTVATEVNIPSTLGGKTVTVIGDKALNWGSTNSLVTKLTIPDTVTEIGVFAFGNNRAITEIIIPESVTTIKEDAFAKCEAVKSLTIGSKVTSIGERAFGRTKSLTSITVTNGANEYFKVESNCLIDVKNAKVLTAYANTSIEVPDGVKMIGEQAFYGSVVTSISLPSTLETIGAEAFYNGKFSTISIPSNVTTIGDYAFYNCSAATNLTLGKSVQTVGNRAFALTNAIANITIENGNNEYFEVSNSLLIDKKNNKVIRALSTVTSVTIPEGIETIGDYAFYKNTKLTSLTLGNSLETIGVSAFESCTGISGTLNIPNSTITVCEKAFYKCTGITKIVVGQSVESLDDQAFDQTKIQNLVLPKSLKKIGYALTANTPIHGKIANNQGVLSNSRNIFYEGTLDEFNKIVMGDANASLKGGSSGDFAHATRHFSYCYALDSALNAEGQFENAHTYTNDTCDEHCETCQKKTRTLENAAHTFENNICTACGAIELSGTKTVIDGDDTYSFTYKIEGDVVTITGWKEPFATRTVTLNNKQVTSFKKINIPETIAGKAVTAIGAKAFNGKCQIITELTIPSTVTTIGEYAFASYGTKNTDVTTLTLPANLTTIGNCAFANYRGIENITIPAGVVEMNGNPFAKNTATFTVETDNTTFEINTNCIYNKVTNTVVCGNTSLTFPATTIEIGAYAYDSWGSVGDYTFNSSTILKKIGDYAFNTTTFYGSLTIPDSVTYIGKYAFSRTGNSNNSDTTGGGLTTLTLPANLEYLGEYAFSNYRAVSSLTIPSKLKEIHKYTFDRWYALVDLNLGNVEIIGDYAFQKCTALATVRLGNSVETIGAYAFDTLSNLKTLTIPASVKSIGYAAFANGNNSIRSGNIYYEGTKEQLRNIKYYNLDGSVAVGNTDADLDNSTGIFNTANNNIFKCTGLHYNSCMHSDNYKHTGELTDKTVEGQTGVKSLTCTACNNVFDLKFKGAAPTLQNNLAITYKVNSALFDSGIITGTPTVKFTMNNVVYDAEFEDIGGVYKFTFRNIAPNKMADIISAELKVNEYTVTMAEYSIVKYCTNMRGTSDKLDTLLDALLNYGSAAQIHTDYNTTSLANPSYDASALVAPTMDAAASLTAMAEGATEKAEWKSATLILEDAITMRFKFALKAEQTIKTLSVLVNGTAVATENIVANTDGTYYVYYNGVDASEMGDAVTVVVKDGDAEVSKTLNYSVEAYAARKVAEYNNPETVNKDENLYNLVVAMMIYGDAAVAYAG